MPGGNGWMCGRVRRYVVELLGERRGPFQRLFKRPWGGWGGARCGGVALLSPHPSARRGDRKEARAHEGRILFQEKVSEKKKKRHPLSRRGPPTDAGEVAASNGTRCSPTKDDPPTPNPHTPTTPHHHPSVSRSLSLAPTPPPQGKRRTPSICATPLSLPRPRPQKIERGLCVSRTRVAFPHHTLVAPAPPKHAA